MEEEVFEQKPREPFCTCLRKFSVCKCQRVESSAIVISAHKQKILSTVGRTECYLRERRVPELIRFLFTKLISQGSEKPIAYLEKLLNDCMLFRAGHGAAPVLYEQKHLEAVVKSFDPGQRGWLSAGQIRRAYITLGLTPDDSLDERLPTETVMNNLKRDQEFELFCLLSAGTTVEESSEESNESFWI